MSYPKLALPNLFPDVNVLKSFAMDHGFQGVDWTMRPEDLPTNRLEEARLLNAWRKLAPLEVRYHLFFPHLEPGDMDHAISASAMEAFRRAIRLVAKASGRRATVHVGLGRDTMDGISWDKTLTNLASLAAEARDRGIRMSLENLVWGWTSRPDMYEKMIRKSGCWATLDIGHARVCEAVRSRAYDVADFVAPHPQRVLNAHIYHEEGPQGHIPPQAASDLEERLTLLRRLPLCDWWVLELREEAPLVHTLGCVKEFLEEQVQRAAG